jgi:biotin operon repressor
MDSAKSINLELTLSVTRGFDEGREYFFCNYPLMALPALWSATKKDVPAKISKQKEPDKGRLPLNILFAIEHGKNPVLSPLWVFVDVPCVFKRGQECGAGIATGVLTIPVVDEPMFIVKDGQRRVAAIGRALAEDPSLWTETVPIFFFVASGRVKKLFEGLFSHIFHFLWEIEAEINVILDASSEQEHTDDVVDGAWTGIRDRIGPFREELRALLVDQGLPAPERLMEVIREWRPKWSGLLKDINKLKPRYKAGYGEPAIDYLRRLGRSTSKLRRTLQKLDGYVEIWNAMAEQHLEDEAKLKREVKMMEVTPANNDRFEWSVEGFDFKFSRSNGNLSIKKGTDALLAGVDARKCTSLEVQFEEDPVLALGSWGLVCDFSHLNREDVIQVKLPKMVTHIVLKDRSKKGQDEPISEKRASMKETGSVQSQHLNAAPKEDGSKGISQSKNCLRGLERFSVVKQDRSALRRIRQGQIIKGFVKNGQVSLSSLSDRFKVPPRSIKKDLLLLKMSDFSIYEVRKGVYELDCDSVKALEGLEDNLLTFQVDLQIDSCRLFNRSQRVFDRMGKILMFFMEQKSVSISSLSAQLGATSGAIQGDVQLMKASGLPISEVGEGLYELNKNAIERLEGFDDDLLVLLLAHRFPFGQRLKVADDEVVRMGRLLMVFMEKVIVEGLWLSEQFGVTLRTIHWDLLLMNLNNFIIREIQKGVYELNEYSVRRLLGCDENELIRSVARQLLIQIPSKKGSGPFLPMINLMAESLTLKDDES